MEASNILAEDTCLNRETQGLVLVSHANTLKQVQAYMLEQQQKASWDQLILCYS